MHVLMHVLVHMKLDTHIKISRDMYNRFILIINVSPPINVPPRLFVIRGRLLADVQRRRFLNL